MGFFFCLFLFLFIFVSFCDVHISSLIETQSTGGEKETGFDLADYLIAEQNRTNQYNSIVDNYNKKLDKVLIDKSLIRDFETILDEQKAILMIDGNLSETQAESYITKAENIRSRVLEVWFLGDDYG